MRKARMQDDRKGKRHDNDPPHPRSLCRELLLLLLPLMPRYCIRLGMIPLQRIPLKNLSQVRAAADFHQGWDFGYLVTNGVIRPLSRRT